MLFSAKHSQQDKKHIRLAIRQQKHCWNAKADMGERKTLSECRKGQLCGCVDN